MVTWQDKKYIIFGLNGTLIRNSTDQIRMTDYVEKFLFLLSSLNHLPQLHLVSNMPMEDLQLRIKKAGLDCFMHQVSSSLSTGLVKADVKFWLGYLEQNNINPTDAVMVDDNPKVVLATVAAGIPSILLTENSLSSDIEYELSDELIKYKNHLSFIANFAGLMPSYNRLMEVVNV